MQITPRDDRKTQGHDPPGTCTVLHVRPCNKSHSHARRADTFPSARAVGPRGRSSARRTLRAHALR
ncbi:hypothetical protein PsYK624_051610 [Phanerochaete sordida]|uniref:Uncharacterized protein n=1 Tax=Phanerochaete sordida TaxID=48140 RepID=A0A9P3G765_9APHY|nr:hypothetical protein PsYK624_051610 [Phanerochaete sordida]